MSIDDQPRAVWLDSLGADTLRYYAARAESSADQAFFYGLADAWDAATADATKASYRLSRPYATVPIDVRPRSRRRLES